MANPLVGSSTSLPFLVMQPYLLSRNGSLVADQVPELGNQECERNKMRHRSVISSGGERSDVGSSDGAVLSLGAYDEVQDEARQHFHRVARWQQLMSVNLPVTITAIGLTLTSDYESWVFF